MLLGKLLLCAPLCLGGGFSRKSLNHKGTENTEKRPNLIPCKARFVKESVSFAQYVDTLLVQRALDAAVQFVQSFKLDARFRV